MDINLKDKTLGIVSSYNDICGNATYTKQLMHDLKNHFKKVECIELDQRLVHSQMRNSVKKKIIDQSLTYDYINIQCEPGLFHSKARKAIKFIEQIIDARSGRDISITFHSLGISNKIINLSYLGSKLFNFKRIISKIFLRSPLLIDPYKEYQSLLLRKIKSLQKENKNITIIVHQKELSENLSMFGISSYYHPIVSAHSGDLEKFYAPDLRKGFVTKYDLNPNLTYVGCYGFYGPYKGHDILIDALLLLPNNFHLIISSNCHPVTNLKIKKINFGKNKSNKKIRKVNSDDNQNLNSSNIDIVEKDPYMMYLVNKILKNNLADRVHFLNHILDEEDFKEMIAAVDISVFPYYEVGQQGSGPVSYATHLSQSGKIILSRTGLFETYEKNFFNDCFTFFDQGNHLELSQKITRALDKNKQLRSARENYNPETNIMTYVNSLSSKKDVINFVQATDYKK